MLFGRRVHRILAYREPVDMRRQIDGLVGLVQNVLREDALLSGTLYVFCNRRRNHLKLVTWDRTGFVLLAKRLEHGHFRFPGEATKQELSVRAFELLLDGILLGSRKARVVERIHDATRRASRIAEP